MDEEEVPPSPSPTPSKDESDKSANESEDEQPETSNNDDNSDATTKRKRTTFERRNIRKIRSDDAIGEATREALEAEKARLARVGRQRPKNEHIIQTLNASEPYDHTIVKCEDDDSGDDIEETSIKRPRIEADEILPKPADVIIVSEDDDDDIAEDAKMRMAQKRKLSSIPLARQVVQEPDIIDLEDSDSESLNDGGSHVNDSQNVPDQFGRVLVNVGHSDKEEDLFVAPQIAKALKPHQVGGIRFLYDNVIESTARISQRGFGCILAHAMGLGKTLQIISFVDVAIRLAKFKTVLILVPINTIQNWSSEFERWLPKETNHVPKENNHVPKETNHIPKENNHVPEENNSTPQESDSASSTDDSVKADAEETVKPNVDEIQTRQFPLFSITDSMKTFESRANEVAKWRSEGGVLLIGYEMFRILVQREGSAARKPKPQKRKKKKGGEQEPEYIDVDKQEELAKMWDDTFSALVQPGPDIVIADEGHRIKNDKAEISQKVKHIKTLRRIVLTGYPLQNNLEEYHCMVDFVRPNYLGSKMEFNNMFNRPITNGMCIDSTPDDKRLMYMRSHVLFDRLQGFVQRRSHKVLRDQLPEKTEYVIFLKMSERQRGFYRLYMDSLHVSKVAATWAQNNPLKAFAVSVKIMNHPDILYNACISQDKESTCTMEDDFDGSVDSPSGMNGTKRPRPNRSGKSSSGSNYLSADFQNIFEKGDALWSTYNSGELENGPKMMIFFELLEAAVQRGERMLAFTQSLSTLDIVETFLNKRQIPGRSDSWTRNITYYRLDGSTPPSEREKMIKAFNAPEGQASLFLLSTRAGCLGINLTAANRVVVFDASWNPCHDCQAVCRVFRYGQTREVFVYRLIMDNTLERKIYDRQVKKQSLSVRVVDETTPDQHFTRQQLELLMSFEDHDLRTLTPEELSRREWRDPILLNVLVKNCESVTEMPFTHESLLIDKREFHLTSKEKREAHQEYESARKDASLYHGIDLNMGHPMSRQSYANFYPKNGSFSNPLLDPRQHPNSTLMKLHKSLESAKFEHQKKKLMASAKGNRYAPLAPAPLPHMGDPKAGKIPNPFAKLMPNQHMNKKLKGANGRLLKKTNDNISVKEVNLPHDLSTPASDGRPSITIPQGTKVKIIQTEKGTYLNHNNFMFALRSKNNPEMIGKPVNPQPIAPAPVPSSQFMEVSRPKPSEELNGLPEVTFQNSTIVPTGPQPMTPMATTPNSRLSEMQMSSTMQSPVMSYPVPQNMMPPPPFTAPQPFTTNAPTTSASVPFNPGPGLPTADAWANGLPPWMQQPPPPPPQPQHRPPFSPMFVPPSSFYDPQCPPRLPWPAGGQEMSTMPGMAPPPSYHQSVLGGPPISTESNDDSQQYYCMPGSESSSMDASFSSIAGNSETGGAFMSNSDNPHMNGDCPPFGQPLHI